MLCISLSMDERVFITGPLKEGESIIVQLVRKARKGTETQVRIGIEAPQQIQIIRENAKNKLPRENINYLKGGIE